VLALLAGEAVALSLAGGALGSLAAYGLVYGLARLVPGQSLAGILKLTSPTLRLVFAVAVVVGFLSGIIPAYRASRVNIAAGLRHLG
jgi:ABC-type antimicrobial peptide transport system permease subunit